MDSTNNIHRIEINSPEQLLDYHVWEHVSHFIMMDEPKKFNDALRTWLQTNALREQP